MRVSTMWAVILAVPAAAIGCGGSGGEDAGPGGGCGTLDPATGEARFCRGGGSQVCVCRTGDCARIDPGCASGYRYAEGTAACVAMDDIEPIIASSGGDDFCPLLDADADADAPDADAETESDADGVEDAGPEGETSAVCGNGVRETGEECDGEPREDCVMACGAPGTRSCIACAWSPCAGYDEVCNGMDDDCDTVCDEGSDCCAGATEECPTACGSAGSRRCSEACGWGECTLPEERCNGADDDCDTLCDQTSDCCAGTVRPCTTACLTTGTQACSAACAWVDCVPPPESCNGADDDCDGLTDEVGGGFACSDGCCNGGETHCACPADCPIAPPPLTPPAPLWPENGAVAGAGIPGLRPTFRWLAASGGCGTAHYEIQIDDTCTTPGFPACTFPSPEASAASVSGTAFTPAADLPAATAAPVGRRYYWRVRACDGALGCSAWSAVRYLEVGRAAADYDGDGRSDLAVGCPFCTGSATSSGSVQVFDGGPGGVGATASIVLAPPGHAGAGVGAVLASGDFNADGYADLVVGAPGLTRESRAGAGGAYLHPGGPAGLAATGILLAPVVAYADAAFGAALAEIGDYNADGFVDLAVGAPGTPDGATGPTGVVVIFSGGPGGLNRAQVIPASPPVRDGRFGAAVAPAGSPAGDGRVRILVGAPGDASAGVTSGRAWEIQLSDAGLPLVRRSLDCPGPQAGAAFGAHLAWIGDLDDDGRADAAVSAPGYDGGAADEGRVFVYLAGPSGLPASPSQTIVPPAPAADVRFGLVVAGGGPGRLAGRVLAVGAPGVGAGAAGEGAVYLFRFSAGAFGTTPSTTLDSPPNQAGAAFGQHLVAALDFNGNGTDDLAAGSPRYDAGTTTDAGRAYVYLNPGSSGPFPSTPSRTLEAPPLANLLFGTAMVRVRR